MLPDPLLSLARRSRGALRRLRGGVQRTTRSLTADADARRIAAALDVRFYLSMNPDVARAGMDPVSHFLEHGWREGRDPTPDFSLRDYVELNPEATVGGRNPFAHYLAQGRAEGRIAKRHLGFRYEIIDRLEPMAVRLARAERHWPKRRPTPAARLDESFADSRSRLAQLHISVSHDNYAVNVGGLQLCVQREAQALAEDGVDHLHLFPNDIYPILRSAAAGGLVGVVWNGSLVGHFRPQDVVRSLTTTLAATPAAGRSFALHSLLGHNVGDVLAILQGAGLSEGFFWIHDFASLCAGFHLLRNDVADCGAPPPDSPACRVCLYGSRRAAHIADHARLFEALKLTVVAPSQSALDTWRQGGGFPHAGAIVLPHATLHPAPRRAAPASAAATGPLTVAFMGAPVAHKGWPVFHDLAARFQDDPRYRFVQFGREAPRHADIEVREVTVSAAAPEAMREALEREGVDIALIWPLCRETFSFTAFEAVGAGAAVLTNPDSGNVAALVAETDQGRVLADETALGDLFESGEALVLSRAQRRPVSRDLVFSRMTAELRKPAPVAPGLP